MTDMHRDSSPSKDPGRGAARVEDRPAARHVYVALSRRSGGLSVGVDLTVSGECSLACLYCQVPRNRPVHGRPVVDAARLARELEETLASGPDRYADVVVAGGGEPTLTANLAEVLAEVERVCQRTGFSKPRRIYTNGVHVATPAVQAALVDWAEHGGQIWVKLDTVNEPTLLHLWRTRLTVAVHVAGIWDLARRCPIGIQTMMMRGPGLDPIEQTARELAIAIDGGLALGAQVTELQLIAPSRPPGDPVAAKGIVPASCAELEQAARIVREKTSLPVAIFP
jgi:wyosine [tRNA(Phe)-imidazoG37] synthetase (radical SAM superfamily)